jgi:hypothetical protein
MKIKIVSIMMAAILFFIAFLSVPCKADEIKMPSWKIGDRWHYYGEKDYNGPMGDKWTYLVEYYYNITGEKIYNTGNKSYEVFVATGFYNNYYNYFDGETYNGGYHIYSNFTDYVIKTNYATVWRFNKTVNEVFPMLGQLTSNITYSECKYIIPDNRMDYPISLGEVWYDNYSYECTSTYNYTLSYPSISKQGYLNYTCSQNLTYVCDNQKDINQDNSYRITVTDTEKMNFYYVWVLDKVGNAIFMDMENIPEYNVVFNEMFPNGQAGITLSLVDGYYNGNTLPPYYFTPEFPLLIIPIIATVMLISRKRMA